MTWIPLHVHSCYSVLDALPSPEEIVKKSVEHGLSAVALTDHGNLFGAVEFYKACRSAGIRPIIGCEVYLSPGSRFDKSKSGQGKIAYHLTLLAKDVRGYHNLMKLSSAGYTEGFYYFPRIDKELLETHAEGLICLSGCSGSLIAHKASSESRVALEEEIDWFRNVFKEDFYLELQRHASSEENLEKEGFFQETWLYQKYKEFIERQRKVNEVLLECAAKYDIPYAATNDSHYLNRKEWSSHEILINIQSGEPCKIGEKDSLGNLKQRIPNPKRRVYPSHEYYFKSPEEMGVLFRDLPKALENTLKIADKCCSELDFKTKHYPVFTPKELEERGGYGEEERKRASEDFLKKLCYDNIPERYREKHLDALRERYPGEDPSEMIRKRLNDELELIIDKGMCDYLLIVYDFISWAKNRGIPVGPGRGSGVGSIILYLIGITDLEPLRFHLFFERFINPDRISYPDIDVDICMEKRSEVIDYTLHKYGKENVAQIITFGTMKAKMAIKDVGRVLSIPLSKVNEMAKLIPEELNMTIDKALEVDPELSEKYREDPETKEVIDIARKLEGSIRNTGVHAAGVVISGSPLTDHIPVCRAKDSDLAVTQFSMKPLEAVGMLKMDFLGLKTLTCIQKAVDMIRETTGAVIDWTDLHLDDAKTFELLNGGRTLGVFQLESSGMADLAVKLHMDKFEEIIAAISLYRPGPMNMIPSFIQRKHGKEKIESEHPWMEDILKETYGVMVYQEQVMQISGKLANFSLGEGDILRRAMGKKDAAEMMRQREKFLTGALKNGIEEDIAGKIFDKMEKFASYGFNKSHATAYAYLSYVTAYLKANYSKEWMAALMTCDSDDTTKVAKFIQEARAMGISILPPDINEAGKFFTPTKEGIRFAITAIKGVGEGIVDEILKERGHRGPFLSLYGFFRRMDLKKIGKKNIELLAKVGCFDFCLKSRQDILASIEPMYETALLEQKEKDKGFINFFSLMNSEEEEPVPVPSEGTLSMSDSERLFIEKELLGFFLSGHPLELYRSTIKRIHALSFEEALRLDTGTVFRTCFVVEKVKVRVSLRGQKKFAVLIISDGTESMELALWSDLFEKHQAVIRENELLCGVLQWEEKEGVRRLRCHWVGSLLQGIEDLIRECDAAYDQAKLFIERRRKAKTMHATKISSQKPAEILPWDIEADMDKISLSHILRLKKHFRGFPGERPVRIFFKKGEERMATLLIEDPWGVESTQTLKRLVRETSPGFLFGEDG